MQCRNHWGREAYGKQSFRITIGRGVGGLFWSCHQIIFFLCSGFSSICFRGIAGLGVAFAMYLLFLWYVFPELFFCQCSVFSSLKILFCVMLLNMPWIGFIIFCIIVWVHLGGTKGCAWKIVSSCKTGF